MPKKRNALGRILLAAGLIVAAFSLWASDKYVVPILTYHSVHDKLAPHLQNANTVNVARFRYHMNFLKKNHYRVISLEELVTSIQSGQRTPSRSVVLTFDDGYDDVYTNAFPILKEHGFTATVFVISDLVGRDGYMTWPQLKEMKESGFTIASHSQTHAYLPEAAEDKQRREIIQSKKIIEDRLGGPVDYFAYPVGGFNEKTKEIVQEAGYQAAFTTNRGYNRLNRDVYALKRIRLSNKDDDNYELWAKFSGFYNLFRAEKPSR